MGKELQAQAYTREQRMNRVLNLHDIVTRPLGPRDRIRAPQILTYRLELSDPRDLREAMSLSEELALALRVENVRVGRTLGHVCIEVGLPRWARTSLWANRLKQRENTSTAKWVALGLTSTGSPVHVNLIGNRSCHALIAGQTGSGKSTTMQLLAWTIVTKMNPDEANLVIVDGKFGSMDDHENPWYWFQRVPHLLHPVVRDTEESVRVFMWLATELARRKETGKRLPIIVTIVDELSELLEVGGGVIPHIVAQLTKIGRGLGMHMIVGTQHPLVGELGGSVTKANLPLRLTGQVTDSSTAYAATRVKGSGAEALQGNGDFLVTLDGQNAHRIQVAMPHHRDLGRMSRGDSTDHLDLDDIEFERVLDLKPNTPDPMNPEHVAIALERRRESGKVGITWLARQLSVGSKKARRVQEFTEGLHVKLSDLGYTLVPMTG